MATLVIAETREIVEYGEPDEPAEPISLVVFDDRLTSSSAAYTSADFNVLLATYSRLRLQALVDQVSGTSPTLTVQVEHAADDRNFVSLNTTAEINAAGLTVGGVTNIVSTGVLGARAMHGTTRLRVQLGGTAPQAYVKLWVTARPRV